MQRYFSLKEEGDCFLLNKDDIFHIKKVMRMREKDNIEIVYQKRTYICEIISLEPFIVKKVSKLNEDNENDLEVIIIQSLVNEQKMDFVLQKGTELGASAFYGFKAHNSVIKENGKNDKKILRWQRIVKEASEQSKRNYIPRVCDIIDIKELCLLEAPLKILLSVNENENNVKNVLQKNKNCDKMIIVVGPEGGFTKDEENVLKENGFISTSLGKRVLRSESASLALLAMINYEWMV